MTDDTNPYERIVITGGLELMSVKEKKIPVMSKEEGSNTSYYATLHFNSVGCSSHPEGSYIEERDLTVKIPKDLYEQLKEKRVLHGSANGRLIFEFPTSNDPSSKY